MAKLESNRRNTVTARCCSLLSCITATLLLLMSPTAVAYGGGSPGQTHAPSTTIRVKIVRSMLLVPVSVNGRLFTFILDSGGGSGFLIDEKAANKLSLVANGAEPATGAGDSRVSLQLVHDLDIEFAGMHSYHATAGVTDFSAVSQYLEVPVDGLLGLHVFLHSIIAIDYCRGEIEIISPQSFEVAARATTIPISRIGEQFASRAAIQLATGSQLSGMFLLDTGAGPVQIGITREEAERAQIPKSSGKHDAIPALGGEFRATIFQAEQLKIGTVTLRNVTVHAAENTSGAMSRGNYAGILGGEFFRHFITIFDVPHQRLILSPGRSCN